MARNARNLATAVAPVLFALALPLLSPSPAAADAPGFRFGFHFGGGGFLGGASGGMGGLVLQLGVKITDAVALYYQGHGMIGAFSEPQVDSIGAFNWNTLALELGNEPFRIAAGPSLDFVAGCELEEGSRQPVCSDGGPYLGINARGAIWLRGLTVWIDLHPTFYPDGTSVAILLGVGFQT